MVRSRVILAALLVAAVVAPVGSAMGAADPTVWRWDRWTNTGELNWSTAANWWQDGWTPLTTPQTQPPAVGTQKVWFYPANGQTVVYDGTSYTNGLMRGGFADFYADSQAGVLSIRGGTLRRSDPSDSLGYLNMYSGQLDVNGGVFQAASIRPQSFPASSPIPSLVNLRSGQIFLSGRMELTWGSTFNQSGGTFTGGLYPSWDSVINMTSGLWIINQSRFDTNPAGVTDMASQINMRGVSILFTGTAATWTGVQNAFETLGTDMGAVNSGFVNNCAVKSMTVDAGSRAYIRNVYKNITGSTAEALYVDKLTLNDGATFSLMDANTKVYYHKLVQGTGATVTFLGANDTFQQVFYDGDANKDGVVDVLDLGILATNWQKSGTGLAGGDFNNDGVVDVLDLGILATNWQMGAGAAGQSFNDAAASVGLVVPEPATLALLTLGGAALIRRKNRK